MVRVFDLTSAEYSEKQVLQGLDGAPINVLVTAGGIRASACMG